MQNRRKLVILSHDLSAIRGITDATGRICELVWARDTSTWLNKINGDVPPSAVLIDNASAPTNSIDMLQAIQRAAPGIRRILITDYCDLSIIVQGLHTGAVQHIVYKPIYGPELLSVLGIAAMGPNVNQTLLQEQIRAAG